MVLCVLLCMLVPLSFPSPSHSSVGALSVSAAPLADCCCSTETVDVGNDEMLYQRLQKLRTYTIFRIFKVDLHSECPFWKDNPQCARRNCAVCDECSEDEVSKRGTVQAGWQEGKQAGVQAERLYSVLDACLADP